MSLAGGGRDYSRGFIAADPDRAQNPGSPHPRMSEMVESALRLLLRSHRKRHKIVALPTFRSGGTLVDIADRDVLYQAMEGR